jgi:ribosomal protein S1
MFESKDIENKYQPQHIVRVRKINTLYCGFFVDLKVGIVVYLYGRLGSGRIPLCYK